MTDATFAKLEVGDLRLDSENPRVPPVVDAADERQVVGWFLSDASLLELMASIAQNGFFPGEPLLVVRAPGAGPKKYIVVEGNRRLAALKLLGQPSLANTRKKSVQAVVADARHRPKSVPTLVFPNRPAIEPYLGYRHITGVKPWSPVAKARFCKRIYASARKKHSHDVALRDAARTIGSRSDYVARLLTALALYERVEHADFYSVDELDEDTLSFSYLVVALNHPNVRDFLGLSDAGDVDLNGLKWRRLKDFTRWAFEEDENGDTRLGETRDMKFLAAVVADEKKLREFKNGMPVRDAAVLGEEGDIAGELSRASTIIQRAIRMAKARKNRKKAVTSLASRVRKMTQQLEILVS